MKLKVLMISMLIFISCSHKISQEGIKINEYMIKEINRVMNVYTLVEGEAVNDIDILIDRGYYEFPEEDMYIINIEENHIVLTNLLYDIISSYNLNTQKFEHRQK